MIMIKKSGSKNSSKSPKLAILMTAAVVGIVAHPLFAAEPQMPAGGPFFYADTCQDGDPLCTVTPAPLPPPAPVAPAPKVDPAKAKADAAAALARKNADDARLRQGTPQVRMTPGEGAAKIPQSAADIRDNYTRKFSPNGNNDTIVFGDDSLTGSGLSADSIHARPKFTIAFKCFDAFWTAFSDPLTSEHQLKVQYATMQRCLDPCVSVMDSAFLSNCVNWSAVSHDRAKIEAGDTDLSYEGSTMKMGGETLTQLGCTADQISQGAMDRTYHGTKTIHLDWDFDANGIPVIKNRVCAAEAGAPVGPPVAVAPAPEPVAVDPAPVPIKEFGKHIAEKFNETHKCPKTREDYAHLKAYAESLVGLGRTTTYIPVPSASGEMPVACGYSSAHDNFFNRAVYCSDSNTCFDQMRDTYALSNATRFTRRNSQDRYFFAQGVDSEGMQSYHNTPGAPKSRGDLLLLPIADGVWIQAYRGGMGFPDDQLNYVGLVMGTAQAVR